MLAIDCHDTICDYMLGMVMRYGEPANWHIDGLQNMFPHVDIANHFDPINHAQFLASLHPMPNAITAIWRFVQWGLPFCYFSADPDKKAIIDWLKFNFFPPAPVYACKGGFEEKAQLIKASPITAIIDDHPKVIMAAVEANLTAYIFDRPWNAHLEVGTRVLGWEHALWRIQHDLSLFGIKHQGTWE